MKESVCKRPKKWKSLSEKETQQFYNYCEEYLLFTKESLRTNQDVGEDFGVDASTISRWGAELKKKGYLPYITEGPKNYFKMKLGALLYETVIVEQVYTSYIHINDLSTRPSLKKKLKEEFGATGENLGIIDFQDTENGILIISSDYYTGKCISTYKDTNVKE